MDLIQEKINALTENELFSLSCDFIKFNSDITNDKIPYYLLELWSTDYAKTNEPTSLSLRIFHYILDLDFNSKENISTYKSHQLFHIFQVILATTVYHLKNNLSFYTVQLFRVDQYHLPQIEEPEQLYAEYIKCVNPSASRISVRRHHKIQLFAPVEISIAPQLSNLILIEGLFHTVFKHLLLDKPDLFRRINLCLTATVKHCILYINKDENKPVKVHLNGTVAFIKATVLCDEDKEYKEKSTLNLPKLIDKDDIKGHCLHTMKRLSDKISFLGNGAKVILSFRH